MKEQKHTRYINTVKEVYKENVNHVTTGNGITESFTVNECVRQGYFLPTLFKLYFNLVVRQMIRKWSIMGVHIGEKIIYTLLFAGDQDDLAEVYGRIYDLGFGNKCTRHMAVEYNRSGCRRYNY